MAMPTAVLDERGSCMMQHRWRHLFLLPCGVTQQQESFYENRSGGCGILICATSGLPFLGRPSVSSCAAAPQRSICSFHRSSAFLDRRVCCVFASDSYGCTGEHKFPESSRQYRWFHDNRTNVIYTYVRARSSIRRRKLSTTWFHDYRTKIKLASSSIRYRKAFDERLPWFTNCTSIIKSTQIRE